MKSNMNGSNTLEQALSALKQGDAQDAIRLLHPLCNEQSTDPQTWFVLGSAHALAGETGAAQEAFQECIRLNPNHFQAKTRLGKVLSQERRFKDAVALLEEALDVKPDHRPAVISLAKALTELKQLDRALSHYRTLINGSESDAEILTLMGNIDRLRGEPESALQLLQQAIARNPRFVPAYVNCGLLLQSLGKHQAAIEHFTQATDLAPRDARIRFLKGMAHMRNDAMELAAMDLEQSFSLNPTDIETGGQLADIYRHLRRIPESLEVSRRILAVDPDNVRAKFYLDAFSNDKGQTAVVRVPADVVRDTYNRNDVGESFEANLKGNLEYYAPAALNKAVRTAFPHTVLPLDILEIGCGTGLCGSQFADIAKKLVGTDLSRQMLDLAGRKNAYTDLYVADLTDVLSSNCAAFDLVIAMDVLCYFGDLSGIFRMCRDTLREHGVFALSVEKPDNDEPWLLHPYGHFVHSLQHLEDSATSAGFSSIHSEELILRKEADEKRIGYISLFKRD